MIVDYDPEKDEANRMKHGVPLVFGVRVFGMPIWRSLAKAVLNQLAPKSPTLLL